MKSTSLGTLVLVLASMMVFGSGCAKNAATGKRSLVLLSAAEEERLGAEAAPQFTAEYGGAVDDAALNRYVTDIGNRLAAVTEADYPDLEWEFTLLDSSVVNAFALPGGKVFITRGLAERLDNEAQLAGILGHEIGHVTARHVEDRVGGGRRDHGHAGGGSRSGCLHGCHARRPGGQRRDATIGSSG